MNQLLARDLTISGRGRPILDRVSLELQPGKLVGIVGPNGAGKSTLLRCLAGLRRPDHGLVTLNGRSASALESAERSRLIGYMPQSFAPAWDYTVREVLELGAGRVPAGPRDLPAAIERHELIAMIDRRWSHLSGGERARALLASVLVANPPVLLADEPGASLDVRHRLDLLQGLRIYASNRTVAVALHDLDLAVQYCDRLVVMHAGAVALDADAASVARDHRLDEVFGVTFRRIAYEGISGPVLVISDRQ